MGGGRDSPRAKRRTDCGMLSIAPLPHAASIDDLRELVVRLGRASSMLAALAVAIDARTHAQPTEARLAAAAADVVAELGAHATIAHASVDALHGLLAELRTFALDDVKLLVGATTGWHHDDDALLLAAGEVSTSMPDAIATRIAPTLDGLVVRLAAPDAAFLEMGLGVAAMS